jgi:hypothetical protein
MAAIQIVPVYLIADRGGISIFAVSWLTFSKIREIDELMMIATSAASVPPLENMLIGAFSIFTIFVILFILACKKHSDGVKRISTGLGMDRFEISDEELISLVEELNQEPDEEYFFPYNVHRKKMKNVVVTILDIRHKMKGARLRTASSVTVFIYEVEDMDLPAFICEPGKRLLKYVYKVAGYEEVSFHDHPSFSEKYLLLSSEVGKLKNLFHQNILDYFEENLECSMRGKGKRLMTTHIAPWALPTPSFEAILKSETEFVRLIGRRK